MDPDEGSDRGSDNQYHGMAAHARSKNDDGRQGTLYFVMTELMFFEMMDSNAYKRAYLCLVMIHPCSVIRVFAVHAIDNALTTATSGDQGSSIRLHGCSGTSEPALGANVTLYEFYLFFFFGLKKKSITLLILIFHKWYLLYVKNEHMSQLIFPDPSLC